MKLTIAALAAPLVLAACANGFPGFGGSQQAGASGPSAAEAQAHRQEMQSLQERMQAARSPEERAALREEHRRLMQEGPAMRGRMGTGMGMGTGRGVRGDGASMSRHGDYGAQTVDYEIEHSPGP